MSELKIKNKKQIKQAYINMGIASALSLINEEYEKHKLPGLAYARSLLENMNSEFKLDLFRKNIRYAQENGFDMVHHEIFNLVINEDDDLVLEISEIKEP